MYWIFGVKFVDLGDSCAVGGDPAMNIIIAWVPVLNAPEYTLPCDFQMWVQYVGLEVKCNSILIFVLFAPLTP